MSEDFEDYLSRLGFVLESQIKILKLYIQPACLACVYIKNVCIVPTRSS